MPVDKLITLIPAYKTAYIDQLLTGLRTQTVAPGKIVFSDDSPGGAFRQALYADALAPLRAGLDIEFHEGPRIGAYENFKHLVRLAEGRAELIHILLDDDILYPEFYERHLGAHASGDFSCSVSRRWTANERGQPIEGQPVPAALRQHAHRMVALEGAVLIATLLPPCVNYLGEFSNAVFRADCADLLLASRLADVSYAGLWDVGAFVDASLRRPLCHLQDYLGCFRTSPGQNSAKTFSPLIKASMVGWAALAAGAYRLGRLDEAQARRCYQIMAPHLRRVYASQPDMAPFIELMPRMAAGEAGALEQFLGAWADFVAVNGL